MVSPEPNDEVLPLVHQGWEHLKLQRPLAAWACWQRALRIEPEHPAAQQALDVLASAAELPLAARQPYRFRTPKGDASRNAWDAAFRNRDLQDLAVAAGVFARLSEADPEDADASYNHALCLAWQGHNAEAIAALDRFVRLSAASDPDAAIGAWTLAEILRQGAGAEELADDFDHILTIPWKMDRGALDAILPRGILRPLPSPDVNAEGNDVPPDVHVFEWLDHALPEPSTALSREDLPEILRRRAPDARRGAVLHTASPGKP